MQNFTILEEKIHSIRSEKTGENPEFETVMKEIPLKIEIEEEKEKNTFERQNLENSQRFHSFRGKIHSIRSQMIGENGEFQSKSTDIRLRIQIEVKMGEKKTHLKSMEKISQF